MSSDIVEVTVEARQYITERCHNGEYMISVKVNNRGCSGHSYVYDIIDPKHVNKFDEVISWSGGGLVIDAATVMFLIGSKLDVKPSIMETILHWENPNITNTCGCGESFSFGPK